MSSRDQMQLNLCLFVLGETKFSVVQFIHPVTLPTETVPTDHVLVLYNFFFHLVYNSQFNRTSVVSYGASVY